MADYKSPNKTRYLNPEGTSSRCTACGGRLKHSIWKMSRCRNCGRDYYRDRLASLPSVIDGYLFINHIPDVDDAGRTKRVELRIFLCNRV